MKLTPAQKRVLQQMKDGWTLTKYFDVWIGYWWEVENGDFNESAGESVVLGLVLAKAIKEGKMWRPYSGSQVTLYALEAEQAEMVG